MGDGLIERTLREIEQQQGNWWPLAGGLFGGSPQRALEVATIYGELVSEATRNRH
jgi:hypothetical protein